MPSGAERPPLGAWVHYFSHFFVFLDAWNFEIKTYAIQDVNMP
jgi:hypothetical protein